MLWFLLIACVNSVKFEKIPSSGNPPDEFYSPGSVYDSDQNQIIYFGMKNAVQNSYDNTLFTFNLGSLQWSKIIPESNFIPSPLCSPFLHLRSDRILLSILGCNDISYINSIFSFNLTSQVWSTIQVASIPGLCYFAATSFDYNGNELVAVYGGYTAGGVSGELYLFDVWRMGFEKMKKNEFQSGFGASQAMVYLDGKIYVYGAEVSNGIQSGFSTAFRIFDLNTNSWTVGYTHNPSLNLSLASPKLAAFNKTLYILGGFFSLTIQPNPEIYQISLSDFSATSIYKDQTGSLSRGYTSLIQLNDSLIQSGGRGPTQFYNDVLQITLSPPSVSILSQSQKLPPSRKNHAMLTYSTSILIFGGETSDSYLNDMWEFNVETLSWKIISPIGDIPAPRSKFAFVQYFDLGFFIFGGIGEQIFGDFYFYSISANYWFLRDLGGDYPRYGSCFVLWNESIVLVGGNSDAGVIDSVWVVDVTSMSLNQATWTSFNTSKVSEQLCFVKESDVNSVVIITVGGIDTSFGLSQYNYVFRVWNEDGEYYSVMIEQSLVSDVALLLSESSSVSYEDVGLVFFGVLWSMFYSNLILKLNFTSQTVEAIPMPFYASGQKTVQFNHSVYMFGGCISDNLLYFKNCYSKSLYKIDFEPLDGVVVPCSYGMIGENCEFCPLGTFMLPDYSCEPCGPGKYTDVPGATTSVSCKPCDYGTYADGNMNSMCKDCPGGTVCYIGSAEPEIILGKDEVLSVQPQAYVSISEDFTYYTVYGMALMVFLVLIGFGFVKRFRKIVLMVDAFTSHHPTELNTAIIYKKTTLGGLFSILFIAFCVITLPGMLYSYVNDNITEQKTLVPLVIIENLIYSQLFVIINLEFYGGYCVESGLCHPKILLFDSSLIYKSRSINCTKLSTTCSVTLTYTNCVVQQQASISLISVEYQSYASKLSVNVTSDSSIPNEISSIFLTLTPPSEKEVFRGSFPSIFAFGLTPSVFYTNTGLWQDGKTGYHVSDLGYQIVGSTFTQKYIVANPSLQLNVLLSLSDVALVTTRDVKFTLILFASSVLGFVFGAMNVFIAAMKNCEVAWKMGEKRIRERRRIEKLMGKGEEIGAVFEDVRRESTGNEEMKSEREAWF